MLLVHPQSSGHGLNMQKGGSIIVWFGLTYSLENYLQLNARLIRQDQENSSVRVIYIMVKYRIDTDIIIALEGENESQKSTLNNLANKLIERYKKKMQ